LPSDVFDIIPLSAFQDHERFTPTQTQTSSGARAGARPGFAPRRFRAGVRAVADTAQADISFR
jgi:hypothetical protein